MKKIILILLVGVVLVGGFYMFNKKEESKEVVVDDKEVVIDDKEVVVVEKDFEGEADPSVMKLNMKTWNWVKTEFGDGKIVEPKKDVFGITFKDDGTFSATTDCNSVGGKYVAKDSEITFSDTVSTLMFCDGSQESEFIDMLNKTQNYLFTSKGELVLTLKMDSGSVYFR